MLKLFQNNLISHVTTALLMPCQSEWTTGNRPLDSIQLCLELLPPLSQQS